MRTEHRSFAILVTVLILAASFTIASTPSAYAAGISFGYGGDGVWRQTATANSQRWFRARVTWDNTTAEGQPAPNERIEGLYLSGVSYSGLVAAPSGHSYADELTSSKGLWDAGNRAATVGSIRLTVVASTTKVYYVPAPGESYYPGQLTGWELTITSGLGATNQYDITDNDVDGGGTYLVLDGATLLDPEVCPDLEVTGNPTTTRVYYDPIPAVSYYPDDTLAGLTLRGTLGEARDQEFDIVGNGQVGPNYYIEVSGDTQFPTDLLQSLTAGTIPAPPPDKFYYTGATYGGGELTGQVIVITSGMAAGQEREISYNDTDGVGDYIVTTAALPGVFAAADTFELKDIMHVCDTAELENVAAALDRPKHFGVARYAVVDGDHVLTVGPFSEYHSHWLVGSVSVTTPNPPPNFKFILHYSTWNATDGVYEAEDPIEIEGTYVTVPLALSSYVGPFIWPSGEMQAWYSGTAVGVDPLVTEDSAAGGVTDPDNGSGSDLYTFRVKYFSGLQDGSGSDWPEMPVIWNPNASPPAEPGWAVDFDEFSYFAISGAPLDHDLKRYVGGTPALDWIYDEWDDRYHDQIGDYVLLGGWDPHTAVLIMDQDYHDPFLMLEESGSLREGIVYKYLIRPTNYLQLLHNIFTLQFDQPYDDEWDTACMTMTGVPVSNVYAATRPGGHKYEFLTSRDWYPPLWEITDEQTSNPKIGHCSVALRGRPGYALEAIHLVNEGWYNSGLIRTEFIQTWYVDGVSGGYGYPYDSQDATQYPKVDPVLTAHPYFAGGYPLPGQALTHIGPSIDGSQTNPFNPLPGTLAPGGEPWGDLSGPSQSGVIAGYNFALCGLWSPLRFTNEDTIWPNYVNIHPETHPTTPFRGGKWTTNTTFAFRINYWQSDDLSPTSMQVWIRKTGEDGNPTTDWARKSMGKVYPTDTTYTNGVLYYYEIDAADLPGGGGAGDYQYYFRASDGTHIAIYPNRPSNDPGYIGVPPGDNDYYWFRVNTPPELSGQSVTPMVATAADPPQGDFLWEVTYTDDDGEVRDTGRLGDQPFKSILWIDLFGDVEGQAEVVSVAGNVITYEVDGGSGDPYAAASLVGMQVLMETGTAEGDQFAITANTVAGSQGTITCTALSGVAATDEFDIVDWFTTTMDETNPADTNYRDGMEYTIDTVKLGFQLTPGTHLYYYEYWDNWAYWINWQQYFMTSDPDPIDQKVEGEMVRLPAEGFLETPYTPPVVPTYSISGTVYDTDGTTPLEGATLSLYEDPYVDPDNLLGEVLSEADGTYEFEDLPNGDYRVIPSYGSWFFDPTEEDVTVLGADETGVDFKLIATSSISGTVYDIGGSPGLEGATLKCYDGSFVDPVDLVDEQDSASDGTYEFEGLVDDTYRVIPSYGGYDFVPTQTDVTVSGDDEPGVDFELQPGDWSISGTILDTGSNAVEDVTVSTTGGSDETDSSGDYLIGNLPNDDYTLTATAPVGPYYTFAPDGWSQPVTISGADQTDIDFEATETTFSVSGTVLDYEDNPITGIDVTDGTNTDTTVSDGTYTITGVSAGLVTITAEPGGGYVFVPQNQDVTVPAPGPSDVTDVDFTGYAGVGHTYDPAGLYLTGVPIDPIDGYAKDVFLSSDIWWWHPSGGIYIGTGHPNATSLLQVLPGKGFFVNYGGATTINVAGTAVPTGIPFTMTLGSSWNMVANPFTNDLPMANIQPTVSGMLLPFAYIYDTSSGSYRLVTDRTGVNVYRDYLAPWEGAWMYACTGTTATIQMTASTSAAEEENQPQQLDLGESGWAIPLVARVGDRSDLTSAVGITDGVEPYSLPNPPAAPDSVDLYLLGGGGSQLAQSLVAPTGETVSWQFVVTTDIPDSEVEVILPDLTQVPNDYSVLLVDLDADRTVYARTAPSYVFNSGEEGALRHFRLEVAPQQGGGLVITTAAAQPAASGAVVTYGVSKACAVSMEVMNISGRVINTLVADQPVAAGVHTHSWNLRSDSGTLVPGGMYLVRIKAVAENGQRVDALCLMSIGR